MNNYEEEEEGGYYDESNNEEDEDCVDVQNYKGIYYNDNNEKKYYEFNAHFSIKDLCSRLEKLALVLNPERERFNQEVSINPPRDKEDEIEKVKVIIKLSNVATENDKTTKIPNFTSVKQKPKPEDLNKSSNKNKSKISYIKSIKESDKESTNVLSKMNFSRPASKLDNKIVEIDNQKRLKFDSKGKKDKSNYDDSKSQNNHSTITEPKDKSSTNFMHNMQQEQNKAESNPLQAETNDKKNLMKKEEEVNKRPHPVEYQNTINTISSIKARPSELKNNILLNNKYKLLKDYIQKPTAKYADSSKSPNKLTEKIFDNQENDYKRLNTEIANVFAIGRPSSNLQQSRNPGMMMKMSKAEKNTINNDYSKEKNNSKDGHGSVSKSKEKRGDDTRLIKNLKESLIKASKSRNFNTLITDSNSNSYNHTHVLNPNTQYFNFKSNSRNIAKDLGLVGVSSSSGVEGMSYSPLTKIFMKEVNNSFKDRNNNDVKTIKSSFHRKENSAVTDSFGKKKIYQSINDYTSLTSFGKKLNGNYVRLDKASIEDKLKLYGGTSISKCADDNKVFFKSKNKQSSKEQSNNSKSKVTTTLEDDFITCLNKDYNKAVTDQKKQSRNTKIDPTISVFESKTFNNAKKSVDFTSSINSGNRMNLLIHKPLLDRITFKKESMDFKNISNKSKIGVNLCEMIQKTSKIIPSQNNYLKTKMDFDFTKVISRQQPTPKKVASNLKANK